MSASDKKTLVDTLAAMQMNNGMVRMYFVSQDVEELMRTTDPSKVQPELAQCITMPLNGFLYGMTVIDKFLKDEKLQGLLEGAKKAGAFPEGLDLTPSLREVEAGESDGGPAKASGSKTKAA